MRKYYCDICNKELGTGIKSLWKISLYFGEVIDLCEECLKYGYLTDNRTIVLNIKVKADK